MHGHLRSKLAAPALALATAAVAGQAFAQVYHQPYTPTSVETMYDGSISDGGPTWNRPNAAGSEYLPTPPTTLGSGGPNYEYHAFSFTPATGGRFHLYSAQSYDGYLHLYENAFDPANPLVNVLAGDDDMGSLNGGAVPNRGGVTGTADSGFRYNLTGGTTYHLVTSNFGTATFGNFHNEVHRLATPLNDIPDGGANQTPGSPLTLTLNVTDHGPIQTFNGLQVKNLQHSWVGDTLITLRHVETGTTVDILDRHNKTSDTSFGASVDLIGDYVFVDSGTPFPTTGAAAAPGTYMISQNAAFGSSTANNPLSAFVGEDVFGTWELTLQDWAEGDVGFVTAFGIDVTLVPEPASLGLLLFGAGALLRRRGRR